MRQRRLPTIYPISPTYRQQLKSSSLCLNIFYHLRQVLRSVTWRESTHQLPFYRHAPYGQPKELKTCLQTIFPFESMRFWLGEFSPLSRLKLLLWLSVQLLSVELGGLKIRLRHQRWILAATGPHSILISDQLCREFSKLMKRL